MQSTPTFEIRLMTVSDLEQAMKLAYSEGWNQLEKDWLRLLSEPSNKCIVAVQDNNIVGTATALSHSGEMAWIGMVLVNKECRGQGIGRMLMVHILDQLSGFRSVKLDATPAGYPVYRKLGFADELILQRMVNPSAGNYQLTGNIPDVISDPDMPGIIKMDTPVFGADRSYILSSIRRDYPEKAFVLKKDGIIKGYSFGRDGSRFHYIGPVVADSFENARSLVLAALRSLQGQAVAIDVFDEKKEMIEWLQSAGFTIQRQFTRMYLNDDTLPGDITNQYLISGPEYG